MMSETRQRTALGGTLVRHGRDDWRWKDGVAEPRVADLSNGRHFNFRVTHYATTHYVEVPLSAAHKERDVLGWVLDGVQAGRYRQSGSGDHTGPRAIAEDGSVTRMRIEPGEDPLHGNEPIVHKRATPRVAMVPVEEWDAWDADNPYGATWDLLDQAQLFATAERLGWRR